jgi:hypothetical protein
MLVCPINRQIFKTICMRAYVNGIVDVDVGGKEMPHDKSG